MPIDAAGLLDTAQFIASPNCDERPADVEISLLVIHNISLPPDEFGGNGVIELFTNQINPQAHPYYQSLQELKVSAHFFIRRDGTIIQFVPCVKRAWHAGVSNWQGMERCNDFSLGIELEGSDLTPFTNAQYASLTTLTQCLCDQYPIRHIAGHADIAPGRKTDPGPCFDWKEYAMGLGNEEYFRTARNF
jgi:AmpD protein